jgi:phenylpropionate dioxygenase-like ring-hydroxylating dioxygenase large terminal subunit
MGANDGMAGNPARGAIDVRALLRLDEGLVHSDVYASQEIFAMEMEKIFHRGWVYLGHDSEIPEPGDYVLRWAGAQSVIMARDDQGRIRVFMNRCRHRANSVAQYEQGNSSFFRCAYHGWTYKNSGELVGVPYREGAYGPDFRNEDFGLVEPRMDVYRGFIWTNLVDNGLSLAEHLGPAAMKSIDIFCDASPEGEVILRQGSIKGLIHANWKFQGGDGYHPPFAHQATFMYMRGKRAGERRNPMAGGGTVETGYKQRDLGRGHYCLDLKWAGTGSRLPDTDWAREYRATMEKTYGKERAEFLIRTGGNPHTVFMPNMHMVNYDVRVLRPIAVDKFEIIFYSAFLKGVPHELNLKRMRDTEDRMGPAGSVNPDDVDMFERNQLGMQQTVDPWKYMARGMGREQPDDDAKTPPEYRVAGTMTGHYADELTQRAQLRWWAEHLSR